MWRKTSIFFQISLLFSFAFISFLAISLFYAKIQPSFEGIKQYNTIVSAIGKMRQFNASLKDIMSFLEEENFTLVRLDSSMRAKFLKEVKAPKNDGFNIGITQEDDDIYITLRTASDFLVYRDRAEFSWSKYYSIAILGASILIIIYLTIMKRLIPLNHIKYEITDMARENVFHKITHGVANQDEIGEFVREFNRCVSKINAVDESRSMFLRSIMHELKTPITKGRIVAEMVNNEKQKERLCGVFERLNTLINEFAKVEELASKNYNAKKTQIFLTDVVDDVMKMLLIDKNNQDSIKLISNNDLLKVDRELFALSLKNLADNAIKYSENAQVIIESRHNDLVVKNKGERLKLDINEYFKPYFKDVKNPLSQGFGLGMYIVKSTLDTQNFKLTYHYHDGYNMFIIHDCIVENSCDLSKHELKRDFKRDLRRDLNVI